MDRSKGVVMDEARERADFHLKVHRIMQQYRQPDLFICPLDGMEYEQHDTDTCCPECGLPEHEAQVEADNLPTWEARRF
jgi:rubrerythrin